jgi:methionyl-tRNA formyltransferase
MTRAVVFGYHNVGVRCLRALIAAGIEVPLVLTHEDNPAETIWFDSVARTAAEYDIPTISPADPNAADIVERVAACKPDFLFSFYYRSMLKGAMLALAPKGALNMHGSLLPKYRGRVPVNWAIIHGETETGATLHYMIDKADSGDVVAQQAVPILPDDTGKEVFDKVTVAAELALSGTLPALLAGNAPRIRQDPGASTYYGGRKPEDGTIDWSKSALAIHNLVRAVAPPYPGAFTLLAGRQARVLRTRVLDANAVPARAPSMTVANGRLVARCGGGGSLAILELEVDGAEVSARDFAATHGAAYGAIGVPLGG